MRSYYSGRTTGTMGFGPGMLSPFIKWLLIANAGVFIAQYFYPLLTPLFGLTPAAFYAEFPLRTYQLVTYMFLHGGLWHILFNMFALWMFGTEIEYTWGTKSFARFYLLAGVAGGILTVLVYPHQLAATIGASGAIYGILIAYWLMFPQRMLYIYFLIPVPVKYAIPGFMILGFLAGAPGTAHMAHLGGALFGLAYLKLDWRWMAFGRKLKALRYRRAEAKLDKRRQEAEDIMKRVDAILDKINDVGIDNLTKAERKFLEDASSLLAKKKEEQRESNR